MNQRGVSSSSRDAYIAFAQVTYGDEHLLHALANGGIDILPMLLGTCASDWSGHKAVIPYKYHVRKQILGGWPRPLLLSHPTIISEEDKWEEKKKRIQSTYDVFLHHLSPSGSKTRK
jgi:hypothetical protein